MLDILGRNKSLLRQCDIAGFLAIYSYFLSDISILPSENIRPPPLPSKKDNVEYFQMPASAWRLSRVGRRPKPKPNLGQNSRLLGSSAYPTVRGGGGDVSPQLERGKVNCEERGRELLLECMKVSLQRMMIHKWCWQQWLQSIIKTTIVTFAEKPYSV